jgi:O-antigen ligase
MGEFLVTKYYNEKNLETLNGRIQLYKTALTVSLENPFMGVGFSRFGEYVSNKYHLRMIKTDLDPHNLWLLIVAELGVFGLILASMFILFFLKSIWVCRNAYRVGKSAEIELCSLMSISVLLFSIVSLAWRSSLILFSTAILMEQASRYLSQRKIESRPPA